MIEKRAVLSCGSLKIVVKYALNDLLKGAELYKLFKIIKIRHMAKRTDGKRVGR